MGKIVFVGDHEDGNILASMGLAKELNRNGHHSYYVGVPDAEELIRREGIDFLPILKSAYPSGSKYSHGRNISTAESRDALCSLFFDQREDLDRLINFIQPDLMVLPPYLSLESLLLHLRYGFQIVHFRNAYCIQPRSEAIHQDCVEILETSSYGARVRSFLHSYGIETGENYRELIQAILHFPQFVSLPPGYEDCGKAEEENCIYVGPLVDLARNESSFDWSIAGGRKHLLFCSLGSQCDRDRDKSRRFFKTVLQAMTGQEQWFMVMSIGNGMTLQDYEPPKNVCLVNWVSQMQMLAKVDLMMVHGGMGTTRECIISGVPMLAYPLMRDQLASAQAIAQHRIGLLGDMDAPDASVIRYQINVILQNEDIRANLSEMRMCFLKCQQEERGTQVIERLLSTEVIAR